MDKKLSILNLSLLFVAALLIGWIIRIWIHPSFPSQISGEALKGSPKTLEAYSGKRNTYSSSLVSKIMKDNLFRKARAEFKVDAPVQVLEKSPALPPPEISVKGIMMMTLKKIAVLEGSYFIGTGKNQVEKKKIKKKGYEVNDYIGDYQISNIEKTSVTLVGKNGNSLTKYLKRNSKTPIQREANALYFKKKKKFSNLEPNQKTANKPRPKPVETSPPPKSAQPTLSPSDPARTPSIPAPAIRISGVPQGGRRNPALRISGSRSPNSQVKTHTSRHISGR